jgi:phosphatidylglycerol:prolipoprotein diacylglycerol transferase
VIGGLLLGTFSIITGKFLFRFKISLLDSFAFALPLAIAIQRMGCFLAGCCHGKIATVPWAVTYPVNSLAHYHHFQSGLIANADFVSLPVHPVQLYEVIGILTCLILLINIRKYLKAQGSLFYCSSLLYILVKIVVEFFRDPLAHTVGGKMIGIFNTTQWFLLPVSLMLIFILTIKEFSPKNLKNIPPDKDLGLTHTFWIIITLSTVLWIMRSWFTYPEMLALAINLFAAIALAGYRITRNIYYSPNRWLYLASFLIPVVTMAQTVPENEQDSLLVKTFKSLSIGYGSGNLVNSHTVHYGEGCDRVSNTEYFNHDYQLIGYGFSRSMVIPAIHQRINLNINALTGKHIETRISDNKKNINYLLGVSPFVSIDRRWVGVGIGLNWGRLTYILESISEYHPPPLPVPSSRTKHTDFYPQFYARLGHERIFYIDYHYANHFPSALPGFQKQIGLGTSFGAKNGLKCRFGLADNFKYVAGYFPFKNRVVLEPLIIWGQSPYFIDTSNNNEPSNLYQFSLGFSYRFNHKEAKKKIER